MNANEDEDINYRIKCIRKEIRALKTWGSKDDEMIWLLNECIKDLQRMLKEKEDK